MLLTKDYIIPNRCEESKILTHWFKQCLKKFSPQGYQKFFNRTSISWVFKTLKSSGLVDKLAQKYPKIQESKVRYAEAVDSIINFSALLK
mmetsp:Transcript_18305/g.16183  ORF Transcript_18305/g.16183 Transcript_18305/m.16183 type:complete len:90 (+) Transcript_18305:567-836(+)